MARIFLHNIRDIRVSSLLYGLDFSALSSFFGASHIGSVRQIPSSREESFFPPLAQVDKTIRKMRRPFFSSSSFDAPRNLCEKEPSKILESEENFIQFSIEDYENCIAMWNQKNDSYFRMSDEIPNSIIINVEDFNADQRKFHTNLTDILNRSDMPLIKMNDYVNGRGRHEQEDITSSLMIPKLDKNLVRIINSSLSEETMKKCNYELLI